MKLSKYISLIEATKSHAAIRKGIVNKPNDDQLQAMKYTAENLFDPVREHIGGPLGATSFFRSDALNIELGGAKSSQHKKGEAVDMDSDLYGIGTNKQIFDFIRQNLPFDQLIWEFGDGDNPAWVHASIKKTKNRQEVLRAYINADGEKKYLPFDLY